MALSIPQILRQFKADVSKALAPETIVKICGYLGHKYRERVLDPVITVQVFLLQILHGNTACTALSRLAGIPFTAEAYCQARSRLPLALFEELDVPVCDEMVTRGYATAREVRGRRRGASLRGCVGASTARVFRCPTPRTCKAILANPRGRPRAAAFR
jgi:hypothetical protein